VLMLLSFGWLGQNATLTYLESRNFTEPLFVFAIMVIAGTRPILILARNGVRLTVEAEPGLVVTGDEAQLQIAFVNIVRNSIEALAAKEGDRSLAIRAWNEDGHANCVISDNGPGIPASKRREIFEIFYSTKTEGMGLGLWLSRTLIQRHGGSLALAETPGGGATFRFSIPAHA